MYVLSRTGGIKTKKEYVHVKLPITYTTTEYMLNIYCTTFQTQVKGMHVWYTIVT